MERKGSLLSPGRLAGLVVGLGLLAGFPPVAMAGDERVDDATYEAVRSALEARGYREVRDVELDDDGHLEADATSAEGHEVDVELDPQSFEILGEEKD
jgi:hypothetical protein